MYLYMKDKEHIRKEEDKNDPYKEFERLVRSNYFSHDPSDPVMQRWLSSMHSSDNGLFTGVEEEKEANS